MMLYEWEGKRLFQQFGLSIPRGVLVNNPDDIEMALYEFQDGRAVVKAQVLSGNRFSFGGVRLVDSKQEIREAILRLFSQTLHGIPVQSVLVEEHLDVVEERYLAITYDEGRGPLCLTSQMGGTGIEQIKNESFTRTFLDVRDENMSAALPYGPALWRAFLSSDARLMEINPMARTSQGQWVALDAKVILDDQAWFRHREWDEYQERSSLMRPLTDRERAARLIDKGDGYYRGTAGSYIEMSGDVAVLFSGGGASIANIDALQAVGHSPANYTEYSGNPPREKVAQLANVVLSKPGLRGLWIAGAVANFTNIDETFQGIIDALDVIRPSFPIVVRRAGPHDEVGMQRMKACAERHGFNMKLFGKEVSMTESAAVLASMIQQMELSRI